MQKNHQKIDINNWTE